MPSCTGFPHLSYMKFEIPSLTSLGSVGESADPLLSISLAGCKVCEYMMDRPYLNTDDYEIDLSLINHLKSYIPTSGLGNLYHTMLYTDATIFDLQRRIQTLSDSDRNVLYYSIGKNSSLTPIDADFITWGREHCFDDEHLFRKCIGLSIQEKFKQIEVRNNQELHQVHQNLAQQFNHGDPIGNDQFNNFPRLADAMDHVQIPVIQEIVYDNYWSHLQRRRARSVY